MTTVYARDCQKIGLCMTGVRRWFVAHDLDFKTFVRDGIDGNILLEFDDEDARRLVAEAERRVKNGR